MTANVLPDDFSDETYFRLNSDVAAAGVDAKQHYLNHGIFEGRKYRMALTDHWNKTHLVGLIATAFGFEKYLEITTALTGGRFPEAKLLSFAVCKRLVYRNDDDMHDGLPVDFGASGEDINGPVADIHRARERFDIILVDGHHTYDCAKRDIEIAFRLLEPGGVLIVHDCNPSSKEAASPTIVAGEWCGVTYKAYLDFVLGNPSFDYFTFDADYGCGVIMKPRGVLRRLKNYARACAQRKLKKVWGQIGLDFDAAFEMFLHEKNTLLRLGAFPLLRHKVRGSKWN